MLRILLQSPAMRKSRKPTQNGRVLNGGNQRDITEMRTKILRDYNAHLQNRRQRLSPREVKSWLRKLQAADALHRRFALILDPNTEFGRDVAVALRINHQLLGLLARLPGGRGDSGGIRHDGRSLNIHLSGSAYLLADYYKKLTGRPHWQEVANHLAEWFPQIRTSADDPADPQWAKRLALKHKRLMGNPRARRKVLLETLWERIPRKASKAHLQRLDRQTWAGQPHPSFIVALMSFAQDPDFKQPSLD